MSTPRQQHPDAWRYARPELAIAAITLIASAICAFALAGAPGVVLVVVVFSVLALAVTTRLLPTGEPSLKPEVPVGPRSPANWFEDYWRLQMRLSEGTVSASSYQLVLGPHLEHLLAARLSERHGVNLYRDPEAARRLLCANPRDSDLWTWVDPGRPEPEDAEAPGIPPRALARLVQRLEQL